MNHLFILILLLVFAQSIVFAGDDASGTVEREMDLSKSYSTYEMNESDFKWSNSLVSKLQYKGKVVHFLKTDLPLVSKNEIIKGRIYQSAEYPNMYYVAEGDAMFELGKNLPFSPGVGGFSMHVPKSKDFIVCLNCLSGGVPLLNSTKVIKGKIKWAGAKWSRL